MHICIGECMFSDRMILLCTKNLVWVDQTLYKGYDSVDVKVLGAVLLTFLSILKERFTPIFSATPSYGKNVSP